MDKELNQHLVAMEERLDQRIEAAVEASEARVVDQLTEVMRKMQTELLRGFEAFSTGQTIRLRKLEADHSNLDTALSGRMDVMERRLLQIEQRLAEAK